MNTNVTTPALLSALEPFCDSNYLDILIELCDAGIGHALNDEQTDSAAAMEDVRGFYMLKKNLEQLLCAVTASYAVGSETAEVLSEAVEVSNEETEEAE